VRALASAPWTTPAAFPYGVLAMQKVVGFETAAPRWHARLCDEARLTLAEAQLAVAALDALSGPGAVAGGQALVAMCDAHGLDDAVGVLDTWLNARD